MVTSANIRNRSDIKLYTYCYNGEVVFCWILLYNNAPREENNNIIEYEERETESK